MRLRRPIQTRFRYGYPTRVNLATHRNSQAHSSKGTQSLHTASEKAVSLLRLVGTRFQVLFHDPSPGHFSPFPHGTCPLSVIRKYLGLPGGPGRFTRDFTGPVLLGNTLKGVACVSPTGLSPSTVGLPRPFDYTRDFSLPVPAAAGTKRSHNPAHATPAGYHTCTV